MSSDTPNVGKKPPNGRELSSTTREVLHSFAEDPVFVDGYEDPVFIDGIEDPIDLWRGLSPPST